MNKENSVEFEQLDEIRVIYLNEPDRMNALSISLKDSLLKTVEEVKKCKNTKIVIFTGKGRAFCAGGDIVAMKEPYDATKVHEGMQISTQIIKEIRQLSQITISVVNGFAAGAGFSLALATDFAIAEQQAKFVIAFKNVGLIPDLGLHYYLQKQIGSRKTKEWIMEGKTLNADEAKLFGFVNQVVVTGNGLDTGISYARSLTEGPFTAFTVSKKLLNEKEDEELYRMMYIENLSQTFLRGNEEHRNYLQKFLKVREK